MTEYLLTRIKRDGSVDVYYLYREGSISNALNQMVWDAFGIVNRSDTIIISYISNNRITQFVIRDGHIIV